MVYVSTNVITRHGKNGEIRDAEIQGRGQREGGRGKRERAEVKPSHMDVFYSGVRQRCARRKGLSAPPSRPRNVPISAVPIASFSTSTQPPFCHAISQRDSIYIYII